MSCEEDFKSWSESDPLWERFTDEDEKEIARDAWFAAARFYRAHHAAVARRMNAPAAAGAIEGGEA